MDKINILFVIPQLEKGGSETLVYDLASRLDRSVFGVSLAYFNYYGNDKFKKAFLDHGIRLHEVKINGKYGMKTMRRMTEIIREHNIHVVNAHHFVSMIYSLYASKIACRRRLIYTEHSRWEVDRASLKWRIIGRILMKRLDCVIGISDDVTQALRDKFKLTISNTVTIRNGVDLEEGKQIRDVERIRKEFGLSARMKVIMTVANFRKIKNHMYMLQGFKELLKEYEDVRLLLIGMGTAGDPENSEIDVRNYIKENALLDKVIMTGQRSDVRELLNVADVFCLTSFKEGLPISMLEAMSCGLPVVGTNVPGIRDVIDHERNGFLVELDDQNKLKLTLLKLLTDEKLRLDYGRESQKIVKDFYSMDQCVRNYQDLFLRYSKAG